MIFFIMNILMLLGGREIRKEATMDSEKERKIQILGECCVDTTNPTHEIDFHSSLSME